MQDRMIPAPHRAAAPRRVAAARLALLLGLFAATTGGALAKEPLPAPPAATRTRSAACKSGRTATSPSRSPPTS
jgi:hypothetical protein